MRCFVLIVLTAVYSACQEKTKPLYQTRVLQLNPQKAKQIAQNIRGEVATTVVEGMELSLWASDSLVADPIAISIDPNGRIFYTSATRQSNSEFDIRGHRNWMTASISFQTVEDRRKFLQETFETDNEEAKRFLKDLNGDGVRDWRDLTVEKEQIWFVEDSAGEGVADRAQLYLEDFHEEITDVANGLEVYNGEVFLGVGPDLWRTRDQDKDGVADSKESISHGYAIHIGFSGHGMSGVKVGPDGRIWWGIGDIGMNVIDKNGKRWKYPNQGVIVRSEPDGSDFEVYSAGLRNTHEFTFDQYGNLITEDNDGDHQWERERLVYLISGSDCGWRTNWQFGKYTDPDNNKYKVWMDERLSIPRWEGQAAYILPPITNYINGPTGLVYNPGTALSEVWYDHFFVAEFRGSPANSPIHAFTLKPDGAGFALDKTIEVISGLLPTGLDFGPDGALYFGDWIDGWGTKDKGRIWKLDVPEAVNTSIRVETKSLIEADFTQKQSMELMTLLAHQDMRVRLKAQFELVKRGKEGFDSFLKNLEQNGDQLSRIHSLWGISQMARKNKDYAPAIVPFLKDSDPEICAQAAKMIGDIRYIEAGSALIPLLKHDSLRVQFFATEALGRIEYEAGIQPIFEMLIANNDQDNWLRHGGIIALARIGKIEPLITAKTHSSRALRIATVVALRRLQAPEIAQYLQDDDELIVTEVARAINDDYSIVAALPNLAKILSLERFSNEALIRRAINANLRVGEKENLKMLLEYATRKSADVKMRAEAIAAISTWPRPSVFDRVDGRYRGVIVRDSQAVIAEVEPLIKAFLVDNQSAIQVAAVQMVARLGISGMDQILLNLLKGRASKELRGAVVTALYRLNSNSFGEAIDIALKDETKEVRSIALELLPESGLSEEKAIQRLQTILKIGTVEEQQAAFAALSNYKSDEAIKVLEEKLDDLIKEKLAPVIKLDLIEAVEIQNASALMEKLEVYKTNQAKLGTLALYKETLRGGDWEKGRNIFYEHEAAQCVRCHTIFEFGGNAGPGLAGLATRLTQEEILAALITPSAAYSPGYGVVMLELKDSTNLAGILMEETPKSLRLKIGKENTQLVQKDQIAKRENIPSSMPAMGDILSRRQIRDLMTFLGSLKEES